jgi:hypothetical protein
MPRRGILSLVVSNLVESARRESSADRSFIDGATAPVQLTKLPDLQHNAVQFAISREMAVDLGIVEPTPQELTDRSGSVADSRIRYAARIALSAEWFLAILDAAGPVGAAAVGLHTPGRYGDCEGCGFEDMAGLPWPCATVLAAAEAAGLPEPDGII